MLNYTSITQARPKDKLGRSSQSSLASPAGGSAKECVAEKIGKRPDVLNSRSLMSSTASISSLVHFRSGLDRARETELFSKLAAEEALVDIPPDLPRMARCNVEEHPLKPETKMKLENLGYYGWWKSDSPSPSPGPVTFSRPQRRISLKEDRIKEFVTPLDRFQHLISLDPAQHRKYTGQIRHEEKLEGHRCFCQHPYEHKGAFGSLKGHLNNINQGLYLIMTLFQLAIKADGARYGQNVVTMKTLKQTVAFSRLSHNIFGIQLESDQTINDLAKPVISNFTDSTWGSEEAVYGGSVSDSGFATKLIYLACKIFRFNEYGTLWADYGHQMLDRAVHQFKNLIKMEADSPDWLPESIKLKHDSEEKLRHILKGLNTVETNLINRRIGCVNDNIIVTFGEVAPVLLVALRPELIRPELVALLEKEPDEEQLEPLEAFWTRRLSTETAYQYVRSGLTGYKVDFPNCDTVDDLPHVLPMMMEAPRCAARHLLDPLKEKVEARVAEILRTKPTHLPVESSTDADSEVDYEMIPWWKRGYQENLNDTRAQLLEVQTEIQKLETQKLPFDDLFDGALDEPKTRNFDLKDDFLADVQPINIGMTDLYGQIPRPGIRHLVEDYKSLHHLESELDYPDRNNSFIQQETLDDFTNMQPPRESWSFTSLMKTPEEDPEWRMGSDRELPNVSSYDNRSRRTSSYENGSRRSSFNSARDTTQSSQNQSNTQPAVTESSEAGWLYQTRSDSKCKLNLYSARYSSSDRKNNDSESAADSLNRSLFG